MQPRFFVVYLAVTTPAFSAFAPHGLQIRFVINLDPPEYPAPAAHTLAIAGHPVTMPSLTLPALLAGKLPRLLTSKDREKGRDGFDYAWYRRQNIRPPLAQRESALRQTADGPADRCGRSSLRERTKTVPGAKVCTDVKPCWEDPSAADALTEHGRAALTPFPDFSGLAADFRKRRCPHPRLTTAHPVITAIDTAARAGDSAALAGPAVIAEFTRS